MLKEILAKRNVPPLKTREEMLEILESEEYGYRIPSPESISFSEDKEFDKGYVLAGKATLTRVEITSKISGKEFTFPMYSVIPKGDKKYPFFTMINFGDSLPHKFLPIEEIIDNGFAVLMVYYKDVTSDDGDFTNGLAGVLYENGERGLKDPGKIHMWAWALKRVMDYAETLNSLDLEKSIVCGHSRLGKTALLAAATDERFKMAYSNDSGCSGAALSRDKVGEDVAFINKTFPYWFSKNYNQYAGNEDKMPFDQHYLLASIAPRYVYVASAKEDQWADPLSEMLSCVLAGETFLQYGMKGFVCENRLPEVGDEFHEGSIGYHLRAGEHYFSREDWNKSIKFAKKKWNI